ncbi:hypothetical protein V497_03561 [Pseudogymnoascus sp. VKM F-4516 (FW-969)]|nr:hypothetical protein V497_03561 [Pseudogymnoascus sp. VKM F-4516 (FW-969)]
MGSDGTDVWGSALDTPNPAPDDEHNSSSHHDVHTDALAASQQRHSRSLSPTPSPSPTYPRSPNPDQDPDLNIELEGLKLSGGTPTLRSPAFGGQWSPGRSGFVSPPKRERYKDDDDEDDEGPGADLLTEVVGEGYVNEEVEEDEGPGEDLLVSPKET